MKTLFIAIASLIFIAGNAQQAGTLNTQFSEDGWDASVYGNNNALTLNKTIIQTDGKILACAAANLATEGCQAVIIRYNSDGTIDTTFGGGDGMVRSKDDESINLYLRAAGMALQSDGKILIAGHNLYSSERIFRLNTDGTFDSSFGINGVLDIPKPNFEFIYHIAVQSDNKIVVAGKSRRVINGIMTPHVFVWRFSKNGTLDTSFGILGAISYNLSLWSGLGENYLNINDLIVLPDNKIVLNQSFAGIAGYNVLFRKFNANGTADLTFGIYGNAIRTEFYEGGSHRNSSSSLQQDGSIVFSFTSFEEEANYSESIFRVSADGEFDHSLHIELGENTTSPNPITVIVNGSRIYVVRKEKAENLSYNMIQCYDLIGNILTTFGENGTALVNQNNIPISSEAEATISEDGNIYLSSYISDSTNQDNTLFLVSNIVGFNSNLSIKENSATTINVAPNPTSGLLYISNLHNLNIDKIEIVDMLGKKVITNTIKATTVDLSNYSSGIYLVRLYSGQSVYKRRVVKK